MPSTNHYDVIIIGSGAGGGTLAFKLAPSGKRILLLERGDWLPRERHNWDAVEVFVKNRYVSADLWHDKDGKPFQPGSHYFVGGATKMYGAALFRFRREDFGALFHYDGISPAWPISYEDIEPYYLKAEHLYQVHGERGVDPTEPPASGPYPYPPISHEPRIQEIADQWRRAGYDPFYAPTAVLLDERDRHQSKCIRCAACDGFPCLVHAKADAETICVRPALEYPNVTLLTGALVKVLTTGPTGRDVRQVLVDCKGEQVSFSADIVTRSFRRPWR
jgi:choline dehydrogenase-like flavoprotein